MPSRRDPTSELRRAIDALPEKTRRAMLDGIRSNKIIVGAYTDSNGGICPMLAAHRQGARTEALRFARAWDAFGKARRVRRASRRELRVLETHLLASLEMEAPDTDLGAVIAEHQALRREMAARAARETPQPSRLLDRPRKADAEGALANLDQYVQAAERELANA